MVIFRLVTGGRQRHTPATLPKLFIKDSVIRFLKVDKTSANIFCLLLRALENFLCNKMWSTEKDEISTGYLPARVHFSRGIFV